MRSFRRFQKQPHTRAQGAVAEEAAARWLERQGYEILDTNVRNPAGELDIVALDGKTLCYIEVKARANPAFGRAIEAVDFKKRRRLMRAAALDLAHRRHEGPCRFDVLGLDPGENGWRAELVRNAFELDPAAFRGNSRRNRPRWG
jgi:putative endonuclease